MAHALAALAMQAPDLPQTPALVRLAIVRAVLRSFRSCPRCASSSGSARRRAARASATTARRSGGQCGIADQILPLIKDDRPIDAEAVLVLKEDKLSPAARTEWQQRVAWSYYLTGDDAAARKLADVARKWQRRMGRAGRLGRRARGLAAKGLGRAHPKRSTRRRECRPIPKWSPPGITGRRGPIWRRSSPIACSRICAPPRGSTKPFTACSRRLRWAWPRSATMMARPRCAMCPNFPMSARHSRLAEIGQLDKAEDLIRWQARIGLPVDHATLTLIAGKVNLPATQLWLAHNGPVGARTTAEGRYPAPDAWTPQGGWRVDKSLVFAHALQESQFRVNVTSPAGARGLMQVMPGTAAMIARRKGLPIIGSLSAPETNMEYGQSYIEQLRDMSATGGMLPKVIAAYNAGPAPLERWNARGEELNKDPLLYIESISYWETRGYVTTVLRNYWMYQQQAGGTEDAEPRCAGAGACGRSSPASGRRTAWWLRRVQLKTRPKGSGPTSSRAKSRDWSMDLSGPFIACIASTSLGTNVDEARVTSWSRGSPMPPQPCLPVRMCRPHRVRWTRHQIDCTTGGPCRDDTLAASNDIP